MKNYSLKFLLTLIYTENTMLLVYIQMILIQILLLGIQREKFIQMPGNNSLQMKKGLTWKIVIEQ